MKRIIKLINENGILSSLVATLIFSFCAFLISRDQSVLTYEEITHEKLFESDDNQALIILNRDSQTIVQDIYYLEVDVWNQGNKKIKRDDMKENFSIELSEGANYIDKIILQETHPNVTRTLYELDSLNERLSINFQFLERGNGIKLKAYYKNNKDSKSKLNVKGYITERGRIKYYNDSFSQKYKNIVILISIMLCMVIGWYFSAFIFEPLHKKSLEFQNSIEKEYLKKIITIVQWFVFLLLVYFVLIKILTPLPMWIFEYLDNFFNQETPFNYLK